MKVLVVQRANMEIAQMPLIRERFLVGRSPHCDVVARAPGIGPVHFLVEWIGEGAFNPKEGIWTIYDLTKAGTKGEERLLEGIVLSEEDRFEYGGLSIRIVDGSSMESAHDFKGGISKSLEEAKRMSGEKGLLEVVLMRTDSHVVEKISYIPRAKSGRIKEHLDADYADLNFKWTNRTISMESKLPDNCQLMRGAELVKPGAGGLETVSLKDEDFWTIRTPNFSVFLRFVPKVKVIKLPRERKVEPGFWFKYWSIVIGGLALVMGVYYIIYSTADKVPDPEPRIATIEVVDYVPPPALEPIPEPAETPQRDPERERKMPRSNTKAASSPIKQKSEEAAAAAQPLPKDEKSITDIGLQSPAPVKNINAVGLLGAMGMKKGEGRVSADQIMHQTTTVEAADSNSGRIAISTPPAGALGVGKKGAKIGASGKDGFQGASTTVSGDKTFNKGSTGPIARVGSRGTGFRLGTGLEGSGQGGNGDSFGDLSTGGLTVSGGLDKETVRRVIAQYKRQIKACYDGQLMLQPNLEGRLRVDWVISPNGRVQTAQATANTTKSTPLEGCLLGVVRAMKFPEAANGRQTRVIYPWQFTK
jgi:hypothetical protein